MNEADNIQNDHPLEEQESTYEKEPKYREISEDELKKILEDHKKWVESIGKEGKRADLSKTNLQEADLKEANLQGANFNYANLKKVNFWKANLIRSDINGANLQEACLNIANLQEASLINSNMEKADLFGANLKEANLSEGNLKYATFNDANLSEANLSNADLQDANFYKANLEMANLRKTNMQKSILTIANLKRTDFYEANLQEANFYGAIVKNTILSKTNMKNTFLGNIKNFTETHLRFANLEGATGLLGNEFCQADVTGTKLPDGIKEFKALDIVEKTSENARKIFFAMLLGCVYSWLTIATTTDVRLLTNTASSPLPIIGTEIPIAWFYIAAPIVLLCIYFYFHLYLIKLWEALSGLPAIFPDGKRLDERAYPWLLNGLVRRHFKLLKKDRPFIAHVQEWITIFLAWWVVPLTMIAFWLRFIPRHDWWGTIFHITLIVTAISFAIIFYRLCALALKRKERIKFNNPWKDKRLYYGLSMVFVQLTLR